MRGGEREVRLAPDRPHKGGDGRIIEHDRCAALLANQVVMRTLADDFEHALIVDLGLADEPEIAEKVQRPIYRCPVDTGRFAADAGVDGIRGQVRAGPPAQGVVDDLPLRGGPQTLLVEQLAKVAAVRGRDRAAVQGGKSIPQTASPGFDPALQQIKLPEAN